MLRRLVVYTLLILTSLDTAAAQACYDLQLSNAGEEPWDLATYNISLFYDATVACYESDQLVADGGIYRSDVRDQIIGGGLIMGSGLPFEF